MAYLTFFRLTYWSTNRPLYSVLTVFKFNTDMLLIIAICTECRTNIDDNIAKTVLILQCGILCHSDVYIMQMKITIEDIITKAVKCWWSKCMMFYQPTCEEMFCFERSWQTAIDISFGPHINEFGCHLKRDWYKQKKCI